MRRRQENSFAFGALPTTSSQSHLTLPTLELDGPARHSERQTRNLTCLCQPVVRLSHVMTIQAESLRAALFLLPLIDSWPAWPTALCSWLWLLRSDDFAATWGPPARAPPLRIELLVLLFKLCIRRVRIPLLELRIPLLELRIPLLELYIPLLDPHPAARALHSAARAPHSAA